MDFPSLTGQNDTCHGTGGRGNDELPRLTGLYIERQLKKCVDRSHAADNAVMNVTASRMDETEMKAVVEYLGALP